MTLQPKKIFGQHFLTNSALCEKITQQIDLNFSQNILEIGPGEGALTKYLKTKTNNLKLIEIDNEACVILKKKFSELQIINEDFLKYNLNNLNWDKYTVVGNFPYNISTQILFKILDNKYSINQVVGMFQKEVAERICSAPKSKKYGVPSVLIQAFFNCEILFDVARENFQPAPNVDSTVIKLSRNQIINLNCDYDKFVNVVKAGFSQRRKKLKNALKNFTKLDNTKLKPLISKRAEELSVFEFIKLTNMLFPNKK
mgnify:CR=1 FL=1